MSTGLKAAEPRVRKILLMLSDIKTRSIVNGSALAPACVRERLVRLGQHRELELRGAAASGR
eukprot:891357-Pleurochrysis_carterae.AAC.1